MRRLACARLFISRLRRLADPRLRWLTHSRLLDARLRPTERVLSALNAFAVLLLLLFARTGLLALEARLVPGLALLLLGRTPRHFCAQRIHLRG